MCLHNIKRHRIVFHIQNLPEDYLSYRSIIKSCLNMIVSKLNIFHSNKQTGKKFFFPAFFLFLFFRLFKTIKIKFNDMQTNNIQLYQQNNKKHIHSAYTHTHNHKTGGKSSLLHEFYHFTGTLLFMMFLLFMMLLQEFFFINFLSYLLQTSPRFSPWEWLRSTWIQSSDKPCSIPGLRLELNVRNQDNPGNHCLPYTTLLSTLYLIYGKVEQVVKRTSSLKI
jgi:hypothetical protein